MSPRDFMSLFLGAKPEGFARFRFGRGVVGNTTYGLWATGAALIGVSFALQASPGMAVIADAGIILIYLVYLGGTYLFAHKHPDMAMLGEPSRAATVLPAATEPGSSLTGNAATGAPNGAIKPFPTRIVRVRPAKDRSPLAAVPQRRTGPAEPLPAASVSAEAIPVEHEEDAAPRAAPAYPAPSAATSQPSAKARKHQRIARTQTRRWNHEDVNHDQRASYWTGRGSIDAQHRRGGYRAWAYGGPRSWGWF
jgi:hypothetical protein